jgi:hypothetical protein
MDIWWITQYRPTRSGHPSICGFSTTYSFLFGVWYCSLSIYSNTAFSNTFLLHSHIIIILAHFTCIVYYYYYYFVNKYIIYLHCIYDYDKIYKKGRRCTLKEHTTPAVII